MSERLLFMLQRVSAMALAPFVLIHLGMMIYAAGGGLSAAEILDRTRGSVGWAVFYGLFVIAVSIHGPIGLRNIAREWLGVQVQTANRVAGVFALILLVLGMRAVVAVI